MYDQNAKTKTWISWERKALLRWNKNHFSSLLKGYQLPKNCLTVRVHLQLTVASINILWSNLIHLSSNNFKLDYLTQKIYVTKYMPVLWRNFFLIFLYISCKSVVYGNFRKDFMIFLHTQTVYIYIYRVRL